MDIKFNNGAIDKESQALVDAFIELFKPIEETLYFLKDQKTGAVFTECHITSKSLINNSTIDVPLDPENQLEYRANRDVVEDDNAFISMKIDAKAGRAFSNIVTEFTLEYDKEHPLKIIGGQHRYIAIKEALDNEQIDTHHGIKVYFNLTMDQRLDVQLISNTNIDVSSDLLDRMYETKQGPQLRDWCQQTGLLEKNQDFADKKQRSSQITVRGARSFIMSYFEGKKDSVSNYEDIRPQPIIAKTGVNDEDWESLKKSQPQMWEDERLLEAGKQFAKLHNAQFTYIMKIKGSTEYANRVMNYAILSAWAYAAGILQSNDVRLVRHYGLSVITKTDPLNVNAMTKAKHKSDPENYRGLGTRADMKERGRLVELFFAQTEKGEGINFSLADYAVKNYHMKIAAIEAKEAKSKI